MARPLISSASSWKCCSTVRSMLRIRASGNRAARRDADSAWSRSPCTAALRDGQQLVGGLAHGGNHHHGPAIETALDDAGDALDGFGGFDGGAAELHHDHQSSSPSECISSAFNTAAPAAPADGVVAQRDELVIEHRALAQTAHEHGHAVVALRIAAGLRTVLLPHVLDGQRRRAGQIALLRQTAKLVERVDQILLRRACAPVPPRSRPCGRPPPARDCNAR